MSSLLSAIPFFLVLAAALSAFSTWLLLAFLIPVLRHRVLDLPTARSSHHQPTPRGGGVVVVVVTLIASSIASIQSGFTGLISLPFIAFPLALVGFIDDCHSLPVSWRYSMQLLTAVFLLSPHGLSWTLWPLLLLAITSVINFTNFMDGLDGLVSGCMTVLISAAALYLSAPWPIWVLIGSLLGFLLWNWTPAKVFMGDVCSTFLGALFAGIVLNASSWPESLGLLLLATPLMGDACTCVLRRLVAGQPLLKPHRLHLYQRLHQGGWSHARVSGLYISSTAVLSLAMLFAGWWAVIPFALLVLLFGYWLDQCVAVPFAQASRA